MVHDEDPEHSVVCLEGSNLEVQLLKKNDSGRLSMNYGRALKTLRDVRQLKQRALADKAGLDASYVSQIESGKRVPSTAAVEAISKALDVPPYLFMLFASEAADLRGISVEQARQLETQLLAVILSCEKGE